jgi:hypothetical protein
VPFGYRLGDGEFVPDEAQEEAIRETIALRAQGRSQRAIAAEMQGVASVLRAAASLELGVANSFAAACDRKGAIEGRPQGAR